MKALGELSSDKCGFHMRACVPPTPPAEQLRENKGQSNARDHFSMERTSVAMVWLVLLSRSQITTGQAPAAPSLGATLSVHAPQAKASQTHTHTLKTKRRLDRETTSSFSRSSRDECGSTRVKGLHIGSKSQDWPTSWSPRSSQVSRFRETHSLGARERHLQFLPRNLRLMTCKRWY